MHKSVGAIIKNEEGKMLMIDRAAPPLFWACPAGHIDEGENPEQAMTREVSEEVGLEVKKHKLLFHEFVDWNECNKGVRGHDWYVFEVLEWEGKIKISQREVKETAWLNEEEIKAKSVEPVWLHWFEKLKLI
jgi:mutator protein MutT